MKRFCRTCDETRECVIMANDISGNPTIAICHTCGDRVS